jgi:hypothetical protein
MCFVALLVGAPSSVSLSSHVDGLLALNPVGSKP